MPSVPSLNTPRHRHTHTHTNLVLLSKTALSLLSLYCISLQLVEPHPELPQALSLLSLGGMQEWQSERVGDWEIKEKRTVHPKKGGKKRRQSGKSD